MFFFKLLICFQYENEMKIGPKWFKKGCPRPGFSSADGELELPPDKFVEPEGWDFLGEWEKKPELRYGT
jgi:hypothetical protein